MSLRFKINLILVLFSLTHLFSFAENYYPYTNIQTGTYVLNVNSKLHAESFFDSIRLIIDIILHPHWYGIG